MDISTSLSAPKSLRVPVKALHDSGCAHSIMRTSTFLKLSKISKTTLRSPDEPIAMVSCTGEVQEISGITDLIIHFEGDNGVHMAFELNVLVHPDLSQDFLLGRDFTGSSAKAFETNSRLYLTDRPDAHVGSVEEMVRDKTLCEVSLITSEASPMYVANNYTVTIPPFAVCNVSCTLKQSPQQAYKLPIRTAGQTTYEVKNATYPNLTSLPILHTFESPDQITIPLRNETNDYIVLNPDTLVAQIELWQNPSEYEVHSLRVTGQPNDWVKVQVNANYPIFISNDMAMNEEEKDEAFMNYVRYGYHHPSMTKEVEDKAALTELYYQDVKEVPESDFETQFEVDHLPMKEKEFAHKIFKLNKEAFSKHPFDLGKAKDIKMKIPITTKEPHIQKYIPIPHAIRPQVREILDQYLDRGIIRECDEPSAFCSNILVVKKKDGKSIRLLLDGRLLNKYTQRLPTNLVTQMELLAHLVGKKWVTTIDLSDAFYQIELHPDSQPLTAFYSEAHGKRYCFMRCPQGLRNSPLHLKLVMDKLFSHMANDVIHYADDIMLATDGTLTEHLKKLSEIFEKLKEGNIKIRPQKVNVARDTVEFLGVIWQKDKISIPDARLMAFQNLPSPTTPKKLKSVICALSYYRKFIPNFANLSHSLMELTTVHPKQYKWTEDHETSFRALIAAICKNAVLHLPDPEQPYYVQTDASDYCGAGRVFQKDKDGDERPIACVSRTFTKTERAYSTVKKEVLALLYTLRSMDFFLRFANKIIILVDAAAILYLRMCKDAAGILLRFSLELSKYDAEVHHVKGENNEVSDVLSRQHADIDRLKEDAKQMVPMSERQTLQILQKLSIPKNYVFTAEEVADMLDAPSLPHPEQKKKAKPSTAKTGKREIKNVPKMLNNRAIKMPKEVQYAPGAKLPREMQHKSKLACNNFQLKGTQNMTMSYHDFSTVSTAILNGTLTAKQFIDAQNADEFCTNIRNRLNSLHRYKIIKGMLFFKTKYTCKPVLPKSLLDAIINAKHFSVFGLHFSKTRILRDITTHYHVQSHVLKDKLQMLKDNCIICQFNASGQKDHELRRVDFIYAPRVTWALDIMPNLPETVSGNQRALLAIDLFTGYIQVCPMPDRTSESLINAINNTIMRPFGIPKFIRSDNEPGLQSTEFYDFLTSLGVEFIPTSVGSPWANGHAERGIRSIKEGLRKFLMQEKVSANWDKYINLFTQAHNQSTSIYGYSPEELMFAYRQPTANDLLQFWPNTTSHEDYVDKIFPEAERRRKDAEAKSELNKDRLRTFKNQSKVLKDFSIGQIVACRQLQVSTGPNSSMKPKHTGPYAILQLNKDGCSCMIEDLRTGSQSKEHFTNLMPINFHPDYNRVQGNFDEEINHMVEMLKQNKLKIKPSTKRLLKLPFPLPDDADETDDEPDPTVRPPDDPANVTQDENSDDDDPTFGNIYYEDDGLEGGVWKEMVDEHLAEMQRREAEGDTEDDDEVEDDPRAHSQASQQEEVETENDDDDEEDGEQVFNENILLCQIEQIKHLFQR